MQHSLSLLRVLLIFMHTSFNNSFIRMLSGTSWYSQISRHFSEKTLQFLCVSLINTPWTILVSLALERSVEDTDRTSSLSAFSQFTLCTPCRDRSRRRGGVEMKGYTGEVVSSQSLSGRTSGVYLLSGRTRGENRPTPLGTAQGCRPWTSARAAPGR